ncbi:MAG: 5-amino-6-(D-ribitylamino)uracil--L-tyrosine 4-hydroxyphenyl transferase CofH [candidate division NC10 bacterium]|nr:5-amino-6-(D-ribitylamino)uracil--L-tyrosine 4-hydroxyphenyl transferase CofH [candidate division NC10 bacterium]
MPTTVMPCDAESAVRSVAPAIARILERALEGRELSREEGLTLAEMGPESLDAFVSVADEIRRRRVGDLITYVVNRNINFTNICIIGCKFCAFSTGPNAADAYDLSFEEISRRAAEAWERGATEVCVQGGLPRELEGSHYRDILRAIKRATPEIHIHAFSPMEVVYGVEKTGMPLADYLAMLKAEGLGSLPGTAAEILDDDVRQLLSRKKVTVTQWVDVITTAHRLGILTTSTMMYGHVEQPVHWVNQLCLLRDIQKETGGFTEFVPLGFVHFNTQLFQEGKSRTGPTVEEHLKVHALARLMLQGVIDNIQVSWVKLGRELSQRCLQAGANDYSGTLMEENISRLAGATAGEYLAPEEFHARIWELGRIPTERSTTYKLLKIFPRDGQ